MGNKSNFSAWTLGLMCSTMALGCAGPLKLLASSESGKQLDGIEQIRTTHDDQVKSRALPYLLNLIDPPKYSSSATKEDARVWKQAIDAIWDMKLSNGRTGLSLVLDDDRALTKFTLAMNSRWSALAESNKCEKNITETLIAHWTQFEAELRLKIMPTLLRQKCHDVGDWLKTQLENPRAAKLYLLGGTMSMQDVKSLHAKIPSATIQKLGNETAQFMAVLDSLERLDELVSKTVGLQRLKKYNRAFSISLVWISSGKKIRPPAHILSAKAEYDKLFPDIMDEIETIDKDINIRLDQIAKGFCSMQSEIHQTKITSMINLDSFDSVFFVGPFLFDQLRTTCGKGPLLNKRSPTGEQ